MLAKHDSAIADVPTNKYVSTAAIHYSYMYESYSKRDFDIFWSGCYDIALSQNMFFESRRLVDTLVTII